MKKLSIFNIKNTLAIVIILVILSHDTFKYGQFIYFKNSV